MCECNYLGHILGCGQVRPNPEKHRAVKRYPVPELCQGIFGVSWDTIEDYAKLAVTLTELTKKSQSNKVKLLPKCKVTFTALTKSLWQSPVLCNPDFDKQFILRTDASDEGLVQLLGKHTYCHSMNRETLLHSWHI